MSAQHFKALSQAESQGTFTNMLRFEFVKKARSGVMGWKPTKEIQNTVSKYRLLLTRNITVLTEEMRKDAEINGGLKTMTSLPGPRLFPIVGNLEHVKKGFKKLHLTQLKNAKKYGAMYKDQLFTRRAVIVQDPEICKEIYRAEGKLPHRDHSLSLGEFVKERRKYNLPKSFTDV